MNRPDVAASAPRCICPAVDLTSYDSAPLRRPSRLPGGVGAVRRRWRIRQLFDADAFLFGLVVVLGAAGLIIATKLGCR